LDTKSIHCVYYFGILLTTVGCELNTLGRTFSAAIKFWVRVKQQL